MDLTEAPYDWRILFSMELIENKVCNLECPFNRVWKAEHEGMLIYVQEFGNEIPKEWLITINKNKKINHVIVEHYFEMDNKIRELTGRQPYWSLPPEMDLVPGNYH